MRRVLLEFEGQAHGHVPSQAKTSTAYPNGVLGFFSDHGLMWREEGEGRLYPLANKAASVLDCLRAACAAAGVEERVECEVAAVEPPRAEGGPFTLRLADGRFERADAVIVAVGGSVARGLLPEGVPFREPEPTLGPHGHRAALAAPPRQYPRARGAGTVAPRRGDAARGARPPRLSDGHPRGRALGVPRGGRGDVPQVRRLGHRRFQPEPPG